MDNNQLRSLFIDPAHDCSHMSEPLEVHSLDRALVLAPSQPGGFGRADVRRVERYSGFFDADFTNNAFIVELKDGRASSSNILATTARAIAASTSRSNRCRKALMTNRSR